MPPTRYAAGTKPAARQAGGYYVTIVTWQKESLFGKIVNGEMELNHYGKVVQKWWYEIENHFPNVETGAFVVMPNHIHGIIFILDGRGTVPVPNANNLHNAKGGETPPLQTSTFQGIPTLGQIIAYFKYQSTKEMNLLDNTGTVTKFWQRNYYEHILRNEKDLRNKTEYIEANPLLWGQDEENPVNT